VHCHYNEAQHTLLGKEDSPSLPRTCRFVLYLGGLTVSNIKTTLFSQGGKPLMSVE